MQRRGDSGEDENPGSDDGPDAERGEVHGPEGAPQGPVGLGRRLGAERGDRFGGGEGHVPQSRLRRPPGERSRDERDRERDERG